MKSSRKMRAWIGAVVCLLLPLSALAGDIVATGSWSRTIDASDLASGPGSDLNPSYESNASATDIGLTAAADYRVDVRRTDGTWDGDFMLYVRRTQVGAGAGSISGGTAYQSVTTTDAEFFTGTGDRTGIKVQYQLDGMSVTISPDTYSSTVTFTIVDL
jgi:hypothetical protein